MHVIKMIAVLNKDNQLVHYSKLQTCVHSVLYEYFKSHMELLFIRFDTETILKLC